MLQDGELIFILGCAGLRYFIYAEKGRTGERRFFLCEDRDDMTGRIMHSLNRPLAVMGCRLRRVIRMLRRCELQDGPPRDAYAGLP